MHRSALPGETRVVESRPAFSYQRRPTAQSQS
jgi:hypothetical protein